MARSMTPEERRAFLLHGTRTGILSTVLANGGPHATPIWFTLDGDDVVFTTHESSLKARHLRRDPRAALTVDLARPPYSYVSIRGHVDMSHDLQQLRHWATVLGGRYMGTDRAEEYGRRNGVAGELVIRLHPDRIIAQADIAD